VSKRLTLTMTEAEASALLGFAAEGECAAEDQVRDGQMHPETWKAGNRATDQLRVLVSKTRYRR
jgi:hypothetical protein